MYKSTAHFYDFFNGSSAESLRRANFVSSYLSRQGVIVDIGAGTGEIAFDLAKMGHRVHGFEPSPYMYSILMERLRGHVDLLPKISAYPNKLGELRGPIDADLAFASSVFSHLSNPERECLLKDLHRHLKMGSYFIFNCVQLVSDRPNKPLTKIGERVIGEITYRQFDSSEQINSSQRRVTWKFEVEHRGQILEKHSEDFYLQMDSLEGLRSLLESAGFRPCDIFGSYDREPVDGLRPGLVVVAQRD